MSMPRWWVALGVLSAGAVVALAPAAPVDAHASLQRSVPSANAVLETAPPDVILDFDEPIEVPLTSIALFDGAGVPVELGDPVAGADDSQVMAAMPPLDSGLFAVVWRVTSADGHVVDGAFAFQIGTAAAGDRDALLDQVRGDGVETRLSWWYGVARFLSLLGAMVLLGGGCWALRRPARVVVEPRVQRVLGVAAVAFVIGSVAAFALFAAQVRDGTAGSAFEPRAWGDARGTTTGRMLFVRSLLAVVAAVMLVREVRRAAPLPTAARSAPASAPGSAARTAAALTVFAAAISVTFSAAGHATAVTPRWLWVAVDAVHLSAAAVWLGGLVVLWAVPVRSSATPEVEHLAGRFSATAIVVVPLVVATGVAQGLRLAGGVDDITSTDWGRLLLVKVVLVVFVVAVAGVSRWLLQHDGAASIRRTLAVEAVVGVVVIGLVAALVAQSPRADVPSAPYEESLAGPGLIASVSISPGRVGANEIHVVLAPSSGSLARVVDLTARVSLPAAGVPVSPATMVGEGPNHFSGTVLFSQPGEWTLELLVQVTESETVLLKSTVAVP